MRDDTKATRVPVPDPHSVENGNNIRGPGALICPRCNRAGPYHKTGEVLQDGVTDIAFLGCKCGARLHFDTRTQTLVEV